MLIAGALIGATAVVGGYGVLLARRLSMGGLWLVALLFLFVALFGAVAIPWVAPGWAVAVAGLGALATALPLWLLLRSRWLVEDGRRWSKMSAPRPKDVSHAAWSHRRRCGPSVSLPSSTPCRGTLRP
jgi:hypothetical protein